MTRSAIWSRGQSPHHNARSAEYSMQRTGACNAHSCGTKEEAVDQLQTAFRRLRRWSADAAAGGRGMPSSSAEETAAYLQEVLALFPYTEEARRWLSTAIAFEVLDLSSTPRGAFWIPDEHKVQLLTDQYAA